jgi:2-keto-4-pentenoate hydratase/2-oxohepta-3-ene-1,7-dioic acid hydratase in catechol pathway
VNAVVRQDSNTSQMAFRIPQLIEASSRIMTLEPGTSSRQAHLREYGR